MQTNTQDEIRSTLQKFQDGYTAREVGRLDDFMQLFAPNDEIEMIGIGAAKRAATEWFEGQSRIREIVGNDWLCVWMWMAVVLFLVIYSLGEVSDPLLLA